MDQADFRNTMLTLGWPPANTAGFEEIAYGAGKGLIGYQDLLNAAGRQAWARANNALSDLGQVGVRKTPQGFFLAHVNRLRMQTFGTAFDDESVSHQSILAVTPWALTDAQFQFCMNYIRTGQIPDDKQFRKKLLTEVEAKIADSADNELRKHTVTFLEYGLVFLGGPAAAILFDLKKSVIGGVIVDFAWDELKSQVTEVLKQDVIARYKIDEVRRIYLADKGLSAYRSVS